MKQDELELKEEELEIKDEELEIKEEEIDQEEDEGSRASLENVEFHRYVNLRALSRLEFMFSLYSLETLI